MPHGDADDGRIDNDAEDAKFSGNGGAQRSANPLASTRTASSDDEQRPSSDIDRAVHDDERLLTHDRTQQSRQHDLDYGNPSIQPADRLLIPSSGSDSASLPSPHNPNEQTARNMHKNLVHDYAPLLCCPACSPPARLVAPTTLHCGHTVCSKHVRTEASSRSSSPSSPPSSLASSSSVENSAHQIPTTRLLYAPTANTPSSVPVVPTCPLPTCQLRVRQQVVTPNIPPDSTVAYYPPIAQPVIPGNAEGTRVTVREPRLDVSVGRVLHLLEKTETWEDRATAELNGHAEDSDRTDEESGDDNEARQDPAAAPDSQASTSIMRSGRRRSRPISRARKRSRRDEHSDGTHHRRVTPEEFEERFNKELMESLTCEICFMLLYQPVTTPCQHTFCAKCLQRSLDHGSKCPLCRQDLPPFSYFQDHPFNKAVLAVLLKAFPEFYTERGRTIEEEERDGRLNTPIFVCQLSFPGIPTLLHFYEPRYRLMLRRCLESTTPCFGMIMPQRTVGAGSNDYGTMLEIRSVQMLPDGRSMVETMGTHRFRIMETGTLDGYMVGRIERVDDIPQALEEEAERSISSLLTSQVESSEQGSSEESSSSRVPAPTTEELIAVCHAFVEQLRNGTAPWVVERLNNTYGPMPDDVSTFGFWMAQVLPIEESEKAKLLVIRSPKARLRLVVHWIEQLNSNWWFSRGCTIS